MRFTNTLAVFVATGWLATAAAFAGPKDELTQYRAAAKSGVMAYNKADYAAAQTAFAQALVHGPQRPALVYYLADIAARRGEPDKALAFFDRYATMGIVEGSDADFTALKAMPAYRAAQARVARNAAALCPCRTFFSGTTGPFIAEGIARDAKSERIFVGGVAARRILAIANGRARDFVKAFPESYSPFGMAVDGARKLLWVTAAVVPQSTGAAQAQQGKSALIAFDLSSGALRGLYPAPDGAKHALGDIALGRDGTIYVSDSIEGSVFRLRLPAHALERVGPAGLFASAQGMVIGADGRQALVADYAMGLLRLDLDSGTLETIAIPADVTTIGIDGLSRLADGSFIATQNGFKVARIVHIRLTPDWSALTSLTVLAANASDVADPSLVIADGDGADVIGVSQWASFDDDKPAPVRALSAWKIVRLDTR
jgi:hypothetical protein